eukprot:TRINITY_DN9469_c0_g1_i2.p1 TRINITY_DN9469_c0_g1~~TRINITY_DN9469_c0_g1_i2.p1  ORF type:complete len:295 (+),score=42.36 TRINITY_DN9469_c0_g1_i2:224-1108(+)
MKIVDSTEKVHPVVSSLGFEITKRLGKGAYGEVWVVGCEGRKYALKEVKKGRYQESEVETLKRVTGHENVVSFLDCFWTGEENGSAYLLMDYIAGGTLEDRIRWQKRKKRRIRESKIMQWVSGLTNGLSFIHSMGIIHRDLKCANVFLTLDDEVKIGDFGMAMDKHTDRPTTTSRPRGKTVCGTPIYMSPEMWLGHPYTEQTDLWSLGIVLYEVTSLRKPFKASSQEELRTKVTTQLPPPLPTVYSPYLRSVITALLSPVPESRPSAATIPTYLSLSFSERSNSSASSCEGGWI